MSPQSAVELSVRWIGDNRPHRQQKWVCGLSKVGKRDLLVGDEVWGVVHGSDLLQQLSSSQILIWLDPEHLTQRERLSPLRGDNPFGKLLDAVLQGEEVPLMADRDASVRDDVEDMPLDRAIIHGSENEEPSVGVGTVVVFSEGCGGCSGHGLGLSGLVWLEGRGILAPTY